MKRNYKLALGAVGITLLLANVQKSMAADITIDGTDENNLARGNPTPGHSPTVQFAFVFGGVTAQNGTDPGATPPGPFTDFNLHSTAFGAIGFGINNVTVPTTDILEVMVTSAADNTLDHLVGDIKEADGDEFQYTITLPAPGTSADIKIPLTAHVFNNGAGDGIADDSAITQIQLQYPFSGTGTEDITIHQVQLTSVPEPASIGLLAIGGLVGLRRRGR